MKKYDDITMKIAERVFEKGDEILEQRKKRAAKIRHISYAVSGLCAALIVCVGAWHFSSSMKKPDEFFHGSDLITITETTTAVNIKTTSIKTTVTTTKNVKQTTVNTSTTMKKSETVAVTTATKNNSPLKTDAAHTTKVSVPSTTAADIDVTTTATSPFTIPVSVPFESKTTTQNAIVTSTTTTQNVDVKVTITQTTTNVVITTYPAAVTGVSFNSHDVFLSSTVTITMTKDNSAITYEKENTLISADKIGKRLFRNIMKVSSFEHGLNYIDTEAFEIADIDIYEAIAVNLPDTDEYYLFINPNYKKEDESS